MGRIWNLDFSDDECDIQVYIPGPPGPPLVNVGTFLVPVDVSGGTIPAPTSRFQRTFISAVSGPVNQPAIPNPPDNGSWLFIIQCVGGNSITIDTAGDIKLSGQCILNPDSILTLLWDGNSRWVEYERNEI